MREREEETSVKGQPGPSVGRKRRAQQGDGQDLAPVVVVV